MSPWDIIGWTGVAIIVAGAVFVVGALLYGAYTAVRDKTWRQR